MVNNLLSLIRFGGTHAPVQKCGGLSRTGIQRDPSVDCPVFSSAVAEVWRAILIRLCASATRPAIIRARHLDQRMLRQADALNFTVYLSERMNCDADASAEE